MASLCLLQQSVRKVVQEIRLEDSVAALKEPHASMEFVTCRLRTLMGCIKYVQIPQGGRPGLYFNVLNRVNTKEATG